MFDRLDEGVDNLLTVITGSPGAGKTLLLSTWLAVRPRPGPVGWVSLEPIDGRPARFWGELLEAVRAASGQPLRQVPDPSAGIDDEFIARVADGLTAIGTPVVIVLDDFERLHSHEVTESLDRLLHHRPEGLRLVIASRLDPALSLQRQRLEGRLTELRSSDLALTSEQAGELFAMAGVHLSEQHVNKLHERTEGWAGGLALAALSLHDHPDPDGFVKTFAGDERTVADYLVEEVLHQQPSDICEFMLRTSVVDELEPGLADALTGRHNGAQMLERLERANAFLVPLDQHRRRYRYHPMFMELLRSQLHYRMPDAFALEHRRAARWFAVNGMPAAAVQHALTAGDVGSATELLAQHWVSLIAAGKAEELVDRIDGLPHHVIAASAELAVAGAGALLDVGDLQQAERYIELSDAKASAVPAKRRAQYTLARTVAKMLEARLRGDYETTRSAAVKVLAGHQFAAVPGGCRALALFNLGVAESWLSAPRDGREHLEEALELARRDSCDYIAVGSLGQLALAEVLRGMLRDGAAFARAAIRIAVRQGWDEQGATAPAYLALAIASFYWAELDAAAEYLERAAGASRRSQERTTRCLIDLLQALLLARSDIGEAARMARTVRNNVGDWGLPESLATQSDVVEVALLAFGGDADRARETLDGGPSNGALAEYDVITARLALADGDPAEALRRLQPGLDGSSAVLHPASLIEVRALAALAKHLLHDDQGALAMLEEALTQAQPQGYRQPLLTIGSPLRELLKRRVRAGTAHRALAGELIQALELKDGFDGADHGRLLLDPLSEREETVLRYLPTLMSKAEIASELFVSVNTVKTHTKNIYRKLGVGTRTEAVKRAKSLNLV